MTVDPPPQQPWWRRLDGVPAGASAGAKGSVDAWALRHPALASMLGGLAILLVGLALGNVVVGLVVGAAWTVLQFAILDLRRRRLP